MGHKFPQADVRGWLTVMKNIYIGEIFLQGIIPDTQNKSWYTFNIFFNK